MKHADLQGGGDVFFTYDGGGNRIRKVWLHSNLVEERIYVGAWEIFRRRQNSITDPIILERETVHVMDEDNRVAIAETQTIGAPGSTLWRFQLDNHLDSAVLELNEAGNAITYEEYHPYGSTAFHAADPAVSAKRYRYTGKERDEETGLSYYGARYYASWLGRWTAVDPEGFVDGPNVYAYALGNPVTFNDPEGTQVVGTRYIYKAKVTTEYSPNFGGGKIPFIPGYEHTKDAFEPVEIIGKVKHHHKHRLHKPKPPHKEKPKATPTEPKPAPGPAAPVAPEPVPEAPTEPEGEGAPAPKAATTGEAVGEFVKGAVEGAATSAAFGFGLALLGPLGVAIGLGFAAYGLYKLATGGYKDVVGTVKRIATGQGTKEDFNSAGNFLGGIVLGKLRSTSRTPTPVKFTLGRQGQVIRATAKITKSNLHQGTSTTPAARLWTRLVGRKHDEAGHIYGKLLGGEGGLLSKNIIPLNRKLNRGAYARLEGRVADYVRGGHRVRVDVALKYPPGSRRPYKITYKVIVNGKVREKKIFRQ